MTEEEQVLIDADLKANPFAKFDDKSDVSVPSATLQIYQYIADYLKENESTHVCRCSAANLCPKRRQLQRQGVKGIPTTPRKIVNFLLGELVEQTLLYFIVKGCVGPGKLYKRVEFGEPLVTYQFNGRDITLFKQRELSFKLSLPSKEGVAQEIVINGHADGFGQLQDDTWELIESKSSANWGFEEFKTKGPGDYTKQAHALMLTDECRALNIKKARFFYLRKETGHPWDRVISYDEQTAQKVKEEFVRVMSDIPIPPPHKPKQEMTGRSPNKKPTGRQILDFPCGGYCPYPGVCFGKYEIDWKSDQWKNQKPIYVVK